MSVETGAATAHGVYALNVGLVGIAGTFLGMPIEAMILGAAGCAIALGRGGIVTRGKAVSTIIASMMFAGTASPAVAAWLINHVDLGAPQEEVLYFKALVPFAIGGGWQWALPRIIAKADVLWAKYVGKGDKS
ncbi:hypothetical protein QDY71_01455 [Kingella negevensis]|uniref:Uncharacterized protein n=1 Tax=Kingella negevensis TaxID=1522312 RepID=A0A238HIJ2_9NEIS|nr:hypothetical protein [Kingella negevensis]MDK4680141.1 hypothetical protein [Kingella negevensis]MDK4682139.1 hypothetical protein [Kingella negevensis]MDK4685013.1 hypothetical protein [Kingella negevensis]MDK4690335.1 hypothetical protein [Kingella negevensis]MDK4692318.1 hypothetical protein [Kingella negevensis]